MSQQNQKQEQEGEEEDGFVQIDHNELVAASGYQTQRGFLGSTTDGELPVGPLTLKIVKSKKKQVAAKQQEKEQNAVEKEEEEGAEELHLLHDEEKEGKMEVLYTFSEEADGKVESMRLSSNLDGVFVKTSKRESSLFVRVDLEDAKKYPQLGRKIYTYTSYTTLQTLKMESARKTAAARRVESKQRFDKEKMEKYVVTLITERERHDFPIKENPERKFALRMNDHKNCRHCNKEFGLMTRRKTCAGCNLNCLCSDCIKPELYVYQDGEKTTKKKENCCYECVYRCLAAAAEPHKRALEASESTARVGIEIEQPFDMEESSRLLFSAEQELGFSSILNQAAVSKNVALVREKMRVLETQQEPESRFLSAAADGIELEGLILRQDLVRDTHSSQQDICFSSLLNQAAVSKNVALVREKMRVLETQQEPESRFLSAAADGIELEGLILRQDLVRDTHSSQQDICFSSLLNQAAVSKNVAVVEEKMRIVQTEETESRFCSSSSSSSSSSGIELESLVLLENLARKTHLETLEDLEGKRNLTHFQNQADSLVIEESETKARGEIEISVEDEMEVVEQDIAKQMTESVKIVKVAVKKRQKRERADEKHEKWQQVASGKGGVNVEVLGQLCLFSVSMMVMGLTDNLQLKRM